MEQERLDDSFFKGLLAESGFTPAPQPSPVSPTGKPPAPTNNKVESNALDFASEVWAETLEAKQKEIKQASWGDVFKSGGVRAGAGPAQGILSLLEMGGAL